MASAPATADDFFHLVERSELVETQRLSSYRRSLESNILAPQDAIDCAQLLVCDGLLTQFQAKLLLLGRWRNFFLGEKYKVLDQIGEGGMGQVFLCEHRVMRRRVAVKILPPNRAQSTVCLDQFMREAQAIARLDHPNIVRAHDIGTHGKLYFLVMEYVEGSNLQQLVELIGRMDVMRAVNYVSQAALGLHNAHWNGMVHRDIKPGNLLVDRHGTAKILDLGLARFTAELRGSEATGILGTADYVSPEQALDSHSADHRADIYSLGATFFFLLTGRVLFPEPNVPHKLISHQTAAPPWVRELRPEVPKQVADILHWMLAKHPDQRPQTAAEVASALQPWFVSVPPPSEDELPAARFAIHGDFDQSSRSSTSMLLTMSGADLGNRTVRIRARRSQPS